MSSWLWLLLLLTGPNLIAYLIHQALLEFYYKARNLKKRYNAKWGLVTGSSSGIGKALAIRLADQGLNVVLVAKPDNLLDEAYVQMQQTYPELQFRNVCKLSICIERAA